jgi:hypothetical protein
MMIKDMKFIFVIGRKLMMKWNGIVQRQRKYWGIVIMPQLGCNGRFLEFTLLLMGMAMISSIPLVKLCLPPVVVVSKSKEKYFEYLNLADKTGNITELAKFLKNEAIDAVKQLSIINFAEYENITPLSSSSKSSIDEKKSLFTEWVITMYQLDD